MFPSTGTKPGYGLYLSIEPLLDTLTGEFVILKMFYFSPKLPYTAGNYRTPQISYCFPKLLCIAGRYQTLHQSAHSPPTSHINKAFSFTQLPLTGFLLFFGPFSVNPRDVLGENPSRSAVLPVWHQQPCHVQSHLNPRLSLFWCLVWTSASCLDHWVAALRLAD